MAKPRRPKSAADRPGKKPGLTETQERFLEAYKQYGYIYPAMVAIGLNSRQNHYNWMENEAYATAFEEAETNAVELAESELRRRGIIGDERRRPYFYRGEQVGEEVWRERDTVALIVLLKAKKPELYREKYDLTSDGRPLIDLAGLRSLRANYNRSLKENGKPKRLKPGKETENGGREEGGNGDNPGTGS